MKKQKQLVSSKIKYLIAVIKKTNKQKFRLKSLINVLFQFYKINELHY